MAKRSNFWRLLRIMLLLYVLLFVAFGNWFARMRTTDWDDTLYVGVYPIAGDTSPATGAYIAALAEPAFRDIERFMQQQAGRYDIAVRDLVRIELGDPVASQPPAPPVDGNVLEVMYFSLRLRYWAWRMQREQDGPAPDVRLFTVYFDPSTREVLDHSLGLQKGLIGVVNAFAARRFEGSNNVVLTHELLHTLGATDKYDPATGLPGFPHGYAEPGRQPRYPQRFAEIMGGRIPVMPGRAEIPRHLDQVVVGPLTAAEIRWPVQ